ncbi:imelysin family protein [Pseudoalteromonas denitrificans]|uniref:Predicted lipoprotein n=1 Tax=Pseudoalteromonas denitrificans DSM 6059 TaxID=1123010 RepID=A0A1I1FTI6_9GAMM|nr:imelysin family protein [Pseudoalteromonas denitrificans]SFC00290.1 Predicted lipoprotein [Pseudoalteromonas denitrificans DSM 6059]
MALNFRFNALCLTICTTLILTACGESTSSSSGAGFGTKNPDNGGTTPTFDESKLIANLVDQVITPTFTAFSEQSKNQLTAITDYCTIESNFTPDVDDNAPVLASLSTAKLSWQNTMSIWQQAEVMQMGPLIENESELRNRIYSWPAISYCGIDQDVAYFEDGIINLDSNKPYDIKSRTSTRRGLFTIQRLLFSTDYSHACTTANDALSDWNSRSIQERKVARCKFAQEVSKDLIDNAEELLTKWNGTQGYANTLKNAGEPGNSFENTHQAINLISDAMFYTDSIVKDKKLGTPLGKFPNSCGLESCPQDVESLDSGFSLANIKANLVAFEMLFLGNSADAQERTGFDDFLVEEGASDTKDALIKGITDAKNATDAIESSLNDALTSQTEKVEHAHSKVKDITDQLKNDFINKLALELPKSSAGDND